MDKVVRIVTTIKAPNHESLVGSGKALDHESLSGFRVFRGSYKPNLHRLFRSPRFRSPRFRCTSLCLSIFTFRFLCFSFLCFVLFARSFRFILLGFVFRCLRTYSVPFWVVFFSSRSWFIGHVVPSLLLRVGWFGCSAFFLGACDRCRCVCTPLCCCASFVVDLVLTPSFVVLVRPSLSSFLCCPQPVNADASCRGRFGRFCELKSFP